MEVFYKKQTETDLIQKNLLATRQLNREIRKLKVNAETVIQDMNQQQKQLRKKCSPEVLRQNKGITSPSTPRRAAERQNLSPVNNYHHHYHQQQQRPKSCSAGLPESHVTSKSARCSSSRAKKTNSSEREKENAQLAAVCQSPSSQASFYNDDRSASSLSTLSRFTCLPSIVVDGVPEVTECSEHLSEERNSYSSNSLALSTRWNSVLDVTDDEVVCGAREQKTEPGDAQEPRSLSRSSSSSSLDQTPRSRSGSLVPQRRRSINISVNLLIRDLWHGISHIELGDGNDSSSWTAEKQSEWDKLKSCRYLRIRADNEENVSDVLS